MKTELVKQLKTLMKGQPEIDGVYIVNKKYFIFQKGEIKEISFCQVLNILSAYPETLIWNCIIEGPEPDGTLPSEIEGYEVLTYTGTKEGIEEFIRFQNPLAKPYIQNEADLHL